MVKAIEKDMKSFKNKLYVSKLMPKQRQSLVQLLLPLEVINGNIVDRFITSEQIGSFFTNCGYSYPNEILYLLNLNFVGPNKMFDDEYRALSSYMEGLGFRYNSVRKAFEVSQVEK